MDSSTNDPDQFTDPLIPSDEPEWPNDDLEAAYQKALDALDHAESRWSLVAPHGLSTDLGDDLGETPLTTPAVTHPNSELKPAATSPIAASDVIPPSSTIAQLALSSTADEPQVTPRQVIEACLFVGGTHLSADRLALLIGREFPSAKVEEMIAELNIAYTQEGRPYEISLGDDGYSYRLRPEFERIRYKVFGMGPKEVKLSQDALETLAVVAYHQPLSEAELVALGKAAPGAVLRQLLRRELLAIERAGGDNTVRYRTTPRFLSLFGIRSLADLPRPEQLAFK
jgi:segregation and condensation protein B